jgi:hypothetical protein
LTESISITAIDSSDFTSSCCSHYFSERTGKDQKRFLKTSISADADKQVITGFIASKNQIHDIRHSEKLLKQCRKTKKSDCSAMHKRYYSEAIHRQIRKNLRAKSVIAIRSWKNEITGCINVRKWPVGSMMFVYTRRQLVENRFSVLKR